MQNLNTLSEADVCLCGDWMYCLCRRRTVYSKELLTHSNHRLRTKKILKKQELSLYFPYSVFRNACFFFPLEALPFRTF